MKTIQTLLPGIFLVLVGVSVFYYFRAEEVAFVRRYVLPPCSQPIAYKVGTIDPKFGVSKSAIIGYLAEATQRWNDAAGKQVFVYAPDDTGAVPVSFIYDSRQQTIRVGSEIDSTEASQAAERKSIEVLQAEYRAAQSAYASAVDALNADSTVYASKVRKINQSGGADSETHSRLNAEKTALQERQIALQAQSEALRSQAANLQARIADYNKKVGAINQIVNNFNAVAGGDFEEGQYVQDAKGRRIDIYAFKNESELVHSLTHEFGHALGLAHNENPASIMFAYNKSSVVLSADDIAALKVACHLP